MPRRYSLYEAKDDPAIKTVAERHAELERAGLIHRVEGTPGRRVLTEAELASALTREAIVLPESPLTFVL